MRTAGAAVGVALLISGCYSQRASKADILKAWNDAAWGSFFPMDPICEKVVSAAGLRLVKAYQNLERLSAIADKLYPESAPLLESPANAACADPQNLPDVGSDAYIAESQKASRRATHVETLNARFADTLGE